MSFLPTTIQNRKLKGGLCDTMQFPAEAANIKAQSAAGGWKSRGTLYIW